MTRYQLRLRYAASHFRSTVPQLTAAALASVLPAGTPYTLTPLVDGYELAADLDRRDHAKAMADLDSAFGQLGFNLLQASIIELATSWLEGGMIGTAGGAIVGTATKSVEGFIALAIAGFVLGALRQTHKAEFVATLTAQGWEITPRESPPASGTALAF